LSKHQKTHSKSDSKSVNSANSGDSSNE
jgi:hypothetical protein